MTNYHRRKHKHSIKGCR